MLTPIGACLIIFSAGGLGLHEALRLRQTSRDADAALRLLARLETLILLSHASLPQILRELGEEMPELFPANEPEADMDISYLDIWSERVRTMPVAESVKPPLRQLGESVFSGNDPQSAIADARERIKAEREEALRKWREYGRLYSSLGFILGCFLAILLA